MVAVTHPIPRSTGRSATGPLPRRSGEPSAAVYRRRRLVAAALLLLVAVALGNLALQLAGPATPSAGAEPVVEVSVVVEPGDTVWSIADALAGGGDVRPVVDALVEANGGAALRAGDRLVLALP